MGAGGEVLSFRAPSHLQGVLSHCLETKHVPLLCNRVIETLCNRDSSHQLLLKFQRWSWLTCEGSSIPLLPTPVLCLGALWLVLVLVPAMLLYLGQCTNALSSTGMILAICHLQMYLACESFLCELKVSTNFTSVSLQAILKVKDLFFPMFLCIR